jgi:hypothetical protein
MRIAEVRQNPLIWLRKKISEDGKTTIIMKEKAFQALDKRTEFTRRIRTKSQQNRSWLCLPGRHTSF